MSLEKRGKASSSGRKSKKKTRNMSNAEESDEEIDEEGLYTFCNKLYNNSSEMYIAL